MLIALAITTGWELSARALGFAPSVYDNYELWSYTLTRALDSDEHALIFIGASRSSVGVHIPTIRRHVPDIVAAQLSTANGSSLPSLELLADHTTFNGRLVVDVMPSVMFTKVSQHRAPGPDSSWPRRYQAESVTQSRPAVASVEQELSLALQQRFVLVSGVLGPSILLDAVRNGRLPSPRYWSITRDRMQVNDFSVINDRLDDLRRNRAELHEQHVEVTDSELQSRIGWINNRVSKISDRGGHVIFLRFPVQGGVRRTEQERFPDHVFWERFASEINNATFVNANDHPSLTRYEMKDDDHIDSADAPRFTESLLELLQL